MSIKVIINADDLGISKGVNRGIAEAHIKGVLNSASLMVNMEHTQDAIQILQKNPNLKCGLHISLTGGKPVTKKEKIPHLIDKNGYFLKRGIYLIGRMLYCRKGVLEDIAKETRAQIELMKAHGLEIHHLDSHDHLHIFPPIMKIMIQLAREYKIPRIRYPNQKFVFFSKSLSQRFKSYFLSLLSLCSRNKLKRNKITICNNFWGLAESGNLNEVTLTAILRSLPEGLNEILCHPGYIDKELLKNFPAAYNWEKELKALTSVKIKSLINENRIEVI